MGDDDQKPCPFCGAAPQEFAASGGPAVCCETCDIDMLVSAWNTRSVQPENDAIRAEGFAAGWAAAIEAAADFIEWAPTRWTRSRDGRSIRAIHMPPDASAALNRMLHEARAQGVREAAVICNASYGDGVGAVHKAILARAAEIEEGRA